MEWLAEQGTGRCDQRMTDTAKIAGRSSTAGHNCPKVS